MTEPATPTPSLNGKTDAMLYGVDLFGEPMRPEPVRSPVAQKFILPPFTVLSARDGNWQDRKRAWLSVGIKSELGRGAALLQLSDACEEFRDRSGDFSSNTGNLTYRMDDMNYGKNKEREKQAAAGSSNARNLTYTGAAAGFDHYRDLEKAKAAKGGDAKSYNIHDWIEGNREELGIEGAQHGDGTSIFDPVLCELVYSWFSAPGAQIIDPFAGGSVRGIVASLLGRKYWGCDLRREQIEANIQQGLDLCGNGHIPDWVCGCSRDKLPGAPDADLVFSCPPYGDLEEYSTDPLDLSCMEHASFLDAYRDIIAKAVGRLRPNRFACFVVGDFRDPKGFYRNFVSDTISAFQSAGAVLYNEAILITAVGSAAMRVTKQFEASRKLCKTHQNVLVFCKGDPKKAAESAGGA